MPRLAIDISNYTGEITLQQAADLRASGVERAIVQLVNPSILTHRQQIPTLLAAGIDVQGYVYVWFSADILFITERIFWACEELRRYAPSGTMIWLDCEQSDTDSPPFDYVHEPTSQKIRAAVNAVLDVDFVPGIYTGAWWWVPGTSDSHEWADVPLWDANYDLDPDIDSVDYGGWTVPHMTQWRGSTTWADVPMVNLDSFEAPAAGEAPPPPSPPDIDEAKRLLRAALEALGG